MKRTWPSILLAGHLALSATQVMGSGFTPTVGLQPEHTLLSMGLQVVLIGLGLFLLFLGGRFPRSTVGLLLLLVGGVLTFSRLAGISYLLALATLLAVFGLLFGLYRRFPRFAMLVFCTWLLPGIYIMYLMHTGSFEFDRILALALCVTGGLLGAMFPRLMVCSLSVGLGIGLLVRFLPLTLGFVPWMGMAATGMVVQLIDFFGFRKEHHTYMEARSVRLQNWKGDTASATAVAGLLMLLLFLVAAFAAPSVHPERGIYESRVARLRDAGLKQPGFLMRENNAFYLLGHAWPVALLTSDSGSMDRLNVLLLGRDPGDLVNGLRTVKDEPELETMARAAEITSKAMAAVGEAVRPGITESELADIVERVFRESGAGGFAFPSLVASGPNACLPHYHQNSATLTEGFVVVDIGCQLDGYASDMTRTFPVDRQYTDAQMELAQLVLQAKETAVALLKPGNRFRDANRASRDVFEAAGLSSFYLHSVGHHVGIDVHDPYADILEPGMVVTIEPGLYIPSGSKADERYWGLGIRIEDTYVITESGSRPITRYDQIPFVNTASDPGVEEEYTVPEGPDADSDSAGTGEEPLAHD